MASSSDWTKQEREDWQTAFVEALENLVPVGAQFHHVTSDERRIDVTVQKVALDGAYPATAVEFHLVRADLPDCLYGFRWGAVWQLVNDDLTEGHRADPIACANIVRVNLEERITAGDYTLPTDYEPGTVRWLN